MRQASWTRRAFAVFLAAALIHVSFGSQAWSQVVSIGAINAPVGGSPAAAVDHFSSPDNAAALNSVFNADLTGSLSAPGVAPVALPLAARAAAAVPAALTPTAVSVAASQDAAPQTVPVTLQAGPRTGRIAHKAAAIISGVQRVFFGKSVEDVGGAPTLHLSQFFRGDSQPGKQDYERLYAPINYVHPPAPPRQPKEPGGKGKGWFGLGALVAALIVPAFIGGLLVMQLGIEAQGSAMAKLTEDAFGDFSILAQVSIFASIGSIIGQQLAQFFSAQKKVGLTKTFYGAQILRAVSLGVMVLLLGTGLMPLPLMFVFYAVNGVVTGVALTALGTLQKTFLDQQGVSQQTFRVWYQLLAEILAVPAPMVLGSLVLKFGAGWITALYPATLLLSLMVFLMFKVIPWGEANRIENQAARAMKAAAPAPTPDEPKIGAWKKIKNAFGRIFASMEEGKDFVFKNAVLKYAFLGATIFDLMNVLIYRLIAPGYGKLVAGSAGMSAVQGNIVGMFSLGGLLLAATLLILEKRAKKKNKGKSEAELAAIERGSMLRWTLLGVPALGLLGVMAFHLVLPFAPVMFMDVNWVPSTVLAAALIPFGFIQVAASIKLNSYFQDRLPADSAKIQKALAFSGSAMTALVIMLMLALKPLFGDIASFNPFPYLAAALIPLGAAVFYIQRKLAGATTPDNLQLAPDVPGEKTAGGFVGALLGVIAAALLLSFMAFIPGITGVLAGLGVLGKFALHLSVALALPAAGWLIDRAIRKRSK